ncbi:hypothetical protein J6590_002433 [Homalodisca vitripennis]|nr:hypothetical protein J6590_002433 [Homalodisca vitripennis]
MIIPHSRSPAVRIYIQFPVTAVVSSLLGSRIDSALLRQWTEKLNWTLGLHLASAGRLAGNMWEVRLSERELRVMAPPQSNQGIGPVPTLSALSLA